ncbi:hypothetical protein ZYGR_0AL01150 [Zygosaccharomyces rouxii]|uniref:DNA polymerase delta subunit 3 n=1 Tax=Zygosaccharomyces rouxii TaxID=4956 RepID=A0A1Q3AFY0_ZYGRO|nr:hypothetical protein ZYGR_0AL01150 [Zygosaccharomyces rouxii]
MEEAIEFINERLFTEEKPVLFTDLIHKFRIGPSKAKKTMYVYYESNKTLKYNCVIVCCYKDRIKIVHDVNHVDSQESLIDCFIYAFNPMEEFIPVNPVVDQREYLSIQNPYKLVVPELRSKTVEEEPTNKAVPKPSIRSKTVPQTTKDEKSKPVPPKKQQQQQPPAKSKDNMLKSTALLAKMRADRENKEAQRQKELAQRREREEQENKSKNDAQMKELNQMFVEDSDENDENQRQESDRPTSTVEPDELEEILDSTAEESLLKQSQSQEEPPKVKQEPQDASYVDEDGYIVTNRSANNSSTSTPAQSRKRPGSSTPTLHQQSKKPAQRKKTQGTLESFFKRSK